MTNDKFNEMSYEEYMALSMDEKVEYSRQLIPYLKYKYSKKDNAFNVANLQCRNQNNGKWNEGKWGDTNRIELLSGYQHRIKPEPETSPVYKKMTPEDYYKLSEEEKYEYCLEILKQVKVKLSSSGHIIAMNLEFWDYDDKVWRRTFNFAGWWENFYRIIPEPSEEA